MALTFPNLSDLGQYRFQFDATSATSNDELLPTGLRLAFGKGTL
jgi:hypothetical protein